MAEADRPYRSGYRISVIGAGRIFAALLDVKGFPEWAVGFGSVTASDAAGRENPDIFLPRTHRGPAPAVHTT